MKANGFHISCVICHKDFYVNISQFKAGKKLCSRKCQTEYKKLGDPVKRFWGKVTKTSGCWLYTGTISSNGYGYFRLTNEKGKFQILAHRFAYELLKGEIPEGLTIDHLCRNRACVNPDHLEPVTMKENILRGIGISAVNARKIECKGGHSLSGSNLYTKPNGARVCKICRRDRDKESYYNMLNNQ